MRGRDFDGSGAKTKLDCIVCHHWNFAPHQRHTNHFPDHIREFFVVRVNRNRDIPKHRFWTRGRNDNFSTAVNRRVCYFPELPLLFLEFHLNIRETRVMKSTIINNPFTSVNQPVVPELLECAVNRLDDFFVQRESVCVPVQRRAQRANLALHSSAIFRHEIPNLLIQFLTRKIKPSFSLFFQIFFKNNPRLKPGMIRARHPQSILAVHPRIANQNVLNRDHQTVANVQISVRIWRRQND